MKRIHYLLASVVIAGGLAAVAVHAQTALPATETNPFLERAQWNGRGGDTSAEERTQRFDRRLADMKSRLQLTADQEKLWPPVETAMRDMQKLSNENREQMRAAMEAARNASTPADPAARMRAMATATAARAAGLNKIADALDPLYKTFDDNQKRRFADMSQFGQRGRDGGRDFDRRGRDGERGEYRGRGYDDDRGHGRRWRDEERGDYRGRGRDYDERDYGRRWRDREEDRGYERRRWRDEDRGYDRYERRRDWQ